MMVQLTNTSAESTLCSNMDIPNFMKNKYEACSGLQGNKENVFNKSISHVSKKQLLPFNRTDVGVFL